MLNVVPVVPLEEELDDALVAENVLEVEDVVVVLDVLCADDLVGEFEDVVEVPTFDGDTVEEPDVELVEPRMLVVIELDDGQA